MSSLAYILEVLLWEGPKGMGNALLSQRGVGVFTKARDKEFE